MFEQLFVRRHAWARHRAGPLLKERLAFLGAMADRGLARQTLRFCAQQLLVFITTFALVRCATRVVARDEVKRKTGDPRVFSLAARWLRFLHRLEEVPVAVSPHARKVKAFAAYMQDERGLSPATIRHRCWLIPPFLNRLSTTGSLREITPHRIDEVLIHGKGNKPRRCPLWTKTVNELLPLVANRSGEEHVFLNRRGQPLTRFGIHALVERYAATLATRLPSVAQKRVSPHMIRHTTATHLLRASVDINTSRAWLGHVCLTTTNVYAEVDMEMKAKALANCEVKEDPSRKPWREQPGLMAFLRTL